MTPFKSAAIFAGAMVVLALASNHASAQDMATTQVVRSVDDLTCKPNDPRNFGTGAIDLLTPGKIDVEATFGPNSAFGRRTGGQTAGVQPPSQDPNNLCQYRDANKLLGPATAKRVVFIGDSITGNWVNATPALFEGDVINRGISSQNSSQMLARFRQDVIDLHPRIVHIMTGTNDVGRPGGNVIYRSDVMSMVDLAQANGIKVILGGIPPALKFWTRDFEPSPEIQRQNAWLREFARQKGIIFVDYYAALVGPDGGMRSDLHNEGMHPNRNGYLIMTPMVKKAIEATLQNATVAAP